MTLNKSKTIGEMGRRTQLRNQVVQKMLEALIDVWSDELVDCERVELEKFLVLEVKMVDRYEQSGALLIGGKLHRAPRVIKRLKVRPGKSLKVRLKT